MKELVCEAFFLSSSQQPIPVSLRSGVEVVVFLHQCFEDFSAAETNLNTGLLSWELRVLYCSIKWFVIMLFAFVQKNA